MIRRKYNHEARTNYNQRKTRRSGTFVVESIHIGCLKKSALLPIFSGLILFTILFLDVRSTYSLSMHFLYDSNMYSQTVVDANFVGHIQWDKHPTRDERFPSVAERVEFYTKKSKKAGLLSRGNEPEGHIESIPCLDKVFRATESQIRKCSHHDDNKNLEIYCGDLLEVFDFWPSGDGGGGDGGGGGGGGGGDPAVLALFGDFKIDDKGKSYPDGIFTKVRYIQSPSGILYPLNHVRHFVPTLSIPFKDRPWDTKKDEPIWRGSNNGVRNWKDRSVLSEREKFVRQYGRKYNIGFSTNQNLLNENDPDVRGKASISEQLEYKYLIAVEGNDVGSGLKWQLLR